jgi:hypothetical protein
MELKAVCSAVYGVNLTCKTLTNHSGTLFTTVATLIPIIVLIRNTRSIQHMTLLAHLWMHWKEWLMLFVQVNIMIGTHNIITSFKIWVCGG